MTINHAGDLPYIKRWLLAARIKTLGLSVTPVLAGTLLAAKNGSWIPSIAVSAALSAMFIQIGTNLWNDAADGERGIDTGKRLGPPRMTALGLLRATDVRRAALAAFVAAAAFGLYLATFGGWTVIAIGLLSLSFGFFYSMGPLPLSGTPFGEMLVVLFFGIVAVVATAYLQGASIGPQILFAGFLTGLPAAAVLLVNNHRDRHTDYEGGRRTLAILIGEDLSKTVYAGLISTSLAGYAILLTMTGTGIWYLLPALGIAAYLVRSIYRTPVSSALNSLIAVTALYQLLLVLTLGVHFLTG